MAPIPLADLAATGRLAGALAAAVGIGDLLLIDGPLGAGKTSLVRCLVERLGGDPAAVASPTFTLMNCYATARMPVYHVDAYRLERPGDLAGLGFAELAEAGLGVIEWAERVSSLFDPVEAWHLRLDHGVNGTRTAAVEPPRRLAGAWSGGG